jgi:tetratricopeptide (TPR) repeat protein
MTRHPRIPALLAIALATLLGVGIFAATGQFRKTDLAHASLPELEKKIVGTTDGRVWLAYGDKLTELNRSDAAVKAYQHALDLQPDLPDARLKLGLALAHSNKDAFFDYVSRLTTNYPKLAVDLLKHPDLNPLHPDPRWNPALTAAQAQAVD